MPQAYVPSDLRLLVRLRAEEACEYCLIAEAYSFFPHEIDHIISRQHGGETVESNLALACIICNKHKGSNLTSIDPETERIVPLFHPRRDRWLSHFQLDGERIEPLTSVGRTTARLLQFNTLPRLAERRLLISTGKLRVPT